MKNTYSEAEQNGADEDVADYMQEQLATESQAFIVGAKVHKTYWEKRGYKESLGADENEKKFHCHALVKMNKKAVKRAVASSRAKLLGDIEDPEVKKKAERALKDISNKFAELDAPVKVESEED